jgi:hypothetical protein
MLLRFSDLMMLELRLGIVTIELMSVSAMLLTELMFVLTLGMLVPLLVDMLM